MTLRRTDLAYDLPPNGVPGVARGIQRAADEVGWSWEPQKADSPDFDRVMQLGGFRVWITCFQESPPKHLLRDYPGVVQVNVGDDLTPLGITSVLPDDRRIGEMAAHYLADQGFTHAGIWGIAGHCFAQRRADAFVAAACERGIRIAPWPSGELLQPLPRHFDDLDRWLLMLPRPAAVFALCDNWAAGLVRWCARRGLRVPEDLAVMGAGDEYEREAAVAILSTIVIPWELIGRLAVQTAKRLLDGENIASPVLVSPQAVITRRSTDTVAVDDSDVAEALKFVRQHAVEPIGVPDILKRIPVARRTLELKFRRVLGRTILEEIHRVRVERTKVLLTTTDLTLSDIARQCGYSSPTMLGISFRSLAGMTPGEYRRQFSSRSPMA